MNESVDVCWDRGEMVEKNLVGLDREFRNLSIK